jgi:hypothetical protein
MVLVGTDEVFASHIVYKQPHNFQVIVGIDIPEPLASTYRAARAAHPDDTFILLLDPIDIGDLASEASLSGPVFHRDAAGNRIDLGSVVIPRGAFKVLYSEELPLSLEP